jgi:hypothetical protein
MSISFKRATKLESRLRMAMIGPTGSGKTFSALSIASGLGKRIAVIDTEHGSAAKYADRFGEYDTLELQSFAPASYVEALELAGREGYDVVIVDSLSHAWMGKDGALEQVDRAAKRSSGNSFAAWRDVTPQHNALVEALLRCPAHLIVTMRSKTEYVLEEDSRGKKVPKKVGMAPIQRDGLEYEFDVVAELNTDHDLLVTKTRMPELDGVVTRNPGPALGAKIALWTRGEKPVPQAPKSVPPPPAAEPPTFAQTFPNKNYAGNTLASCKDLEILKDYKVWLEAQLNDPRKRRKAEVALEVLADEFARRIELEATTKADPIIEGLEREVYKKLELTGDAEPSYLDGDA